MSNYSFLTGSPCGCHHPADDRWYRGIIIGYADDSLRNVRVELVDIGLVADLARCRIKQLPTEYLDVRAFARLRWNH